MGETSIAGQVMVDGYPSSILSGDAAADSDRVDQNKWWSGQPRLTFVQPYLELFERASQPFSLNLSANVLDDDFPEWCIWMN